MHRLLNMQHRLKTFLNHHVEMAFRSRLPCRLTSTWHLGVQYARAGESSDGLRQHLWLKCNAGEAVGSVRLALTTWGPRKQHLEHACKCGRVGSLTHRLHWMQALFRTDYGTQGAEVEASCLCTGSAFRQSAVGSIFGQHCLAGSSED